MYQALSLVPWVWRERHLDGAVGGGPWLLPWHLGSSLGALLGSPSSLLSQTGFALSFSSIVAVMLISLCSSGLTLASGLAARSLPLAAPVRPRKYPLTGCGLIQASVVMGVEGPAKLLPTAV